MRSVGELLANQFNIGLTRMARIIRERMTLQDSEKITPYDLVNARTITAVIQTFFGSSQLCQFMDQTNPLAELTHKRRLSALGPGGLTRDRAGFEVRDVHYTHYGRMCPIETPEGPNIGLISTLSTYARVNEFGFLETPYRQVKNGVASQTRHRVPLRRRGGPARIAQANEPIGDERQVHRDTRLIVRHRGEFPHHRPRRRRLHGRLAHADREPGGGAHSVPRARRRQPRAHGIEHAAPGGAAAAHRGAAGRHRARGQGGPRLRAPSSPPSAAGVVESVSAEAIVVKFDRPKGERRIVDFSEASGLDIYPLTKFKRSNQDTCINQRPLVREGDRVEAGDRSPTAPPPSSGELALGANVLVAFMPWGGYNFEDAILVSERLIKDDVFTSIHIEEFELQVRDTKRGRGGDHPRDPQRRRGRGEEPRRGRHHPHRRAACAPGDILVGKVTPKGETDLSPEERLLRAIFGEKAGDVRDASLKAPPGMDGIVIDIKVFSRREKDETTRKTGEEEDRAAQAATRKKERAADHRDPRRRGGASCSTARPPTGSYPRRTGEELIQAGRKITKSRAGQDRLRRAPLERAAHRAAARSTRRFWRQMEAAQDAIDRIERELEKDIEKITRGDELPPGVVKLVKVFIAKKRQLSVGDKMAGRHGNKGVVSKILPEEDMPYLPDGTPVDIVLNPLGVPSRMNIGQILETHLGLGRRTSSATRWPRRSSPAPRWTRSRRSCAKAGLPEDGKTDALRRPHRRARSTSAVTVGYIYMLKLTHLVDDKIHARSIGPYSLVTQQPLGGKAQFGGQRFGEMEVWALEAYGAAYTLQELLTVKSDDVPGRSRIYEAIVKGENPPEPGIPESFNVLVKELQSLCLDIEFVSSKE